MINLERLEESIGYKFKNINLLRQALTHTSYANENHIESNEKLEFLGDAILEYVISNFLYKNYYHLKEGEMTKVRAAVVCTQSLANIAILHNFSDFLNLGKSEIANNGSKRPAVLEDCVESVIAAIYLDSGIEEAEKFIIKNLACEVEIASKNVGQRDFKTVLQEKLQIHGNTKIIYNITDEIGPDHDKTFFAEVSNNGKVLASGVGKSKKLAEMQAAKKALEKMKEIN